MAVGHDMRADFVPAQLAQNASSCQRRSRVDEDTGDQIGIDRMRCESAQLVHIRREGCLYGQ